ncbi:MAG: hypothetical protein NC240_06535 [Clostridium sp.]|nr:hypothetical protein [Clostridium sp.]
MKKKVLIACMCVMMSFLCACGKSKETQFVEEKISAIGTVTWENESAIVEAESAYEELSDKDKKDVENYNDLVSAREKYNEELKKHYSSMIEEANIKIADLDAKGAYEIAVSLPEEYSSEANDIIKKVDSMCYTNTFIVKFENVVSQLPKSTSGPETQTANVVIGHNYDSVDAMSSAFTEYYNYLKTYYTPLGSDSTNDVIYDIASQSYQFNDENGNFIQISSASVLGFNSVTLAYDKSADFRAVVEW